MELDIQLFGGRGASSNIKISKKTQRIYETNSNGNKHLVGYNYNDYRIDVQRDYSTRAFGYEGKKWYYTNLKSGKRISTETLREIKEEIEKDIKRRK